MVEPEGTPCSSQFPVEHYIEARAQASFLTHDKLDLVLLGYIESAALLTSTIIDGRHANTAERNRVTTKYKHHGLNVCKKTFLFLHAVSKDQLQTLKLHYIGAGLKAHIHGNTKRAPKHNLPYSTKKHVAKFLENYAEENALLLPGRIPGYKRDDIKLLPSSQSKWVCVQYAIKEIWVKSPQVITFR